MEAHRYSDIEALNEAFAAVELDARALVSGLSEAMGDWRATPASWSVAQCLDHLATANRVYLRAMQPTAERALAGGRVRRRPAVPGVIGGWFVRTQEPPPRRVFKSRAPKIIEPRSRPALADATASFLASHDDVRRFLHRYAEIDLAGVRFPNPFIPGVRFSLATGLHVIAAHERRHLWQGWQVRRAAEGARPDQA